MIRMDIVFPGNMLYVHVDLMLQFSSHHLILSRALVGVDSNTLFVF